MRDTGCVLLACILLGCVFLALVLGAPVVTGSGLTWDNTTSIARIQARERTDLARISAQDADSERWHSTVQWLIVAGVVVAVAVVSAHTIRHHADKRTAVQLAALPILMARPGAYLARVDGEWCVVDDTRQELVPVTRRLPG